MVRELAVEAPGGYDRLVPRERPSAALREGEVRVAARAAGVNYADALVRMGVYAAVPSYPVVPGFEFAGTVVESRSKRFKAGDRALGVTRFGGYASEQAVPEGRLWPTPPGWSDAQAAAFPAVHLTAWHGLANLAHLAPGATVLVHSAAGGVGQAAVRLTKLLGGRAVGVVGAPHKVEACRAAGADAVIDKSSVSLWAEAERLAPGGYDVVLDANGFTTLRESYRHLAKCGLLLVYGFHGMLPRRGGRVRWLSLAFDWLRTPRFDPFDLTSSNKGVIGFNVVHLFDREPLLSGGLERMLGWAREGRLAPPEVTEVPFERAWEAHRDLESGGTTGKLVLTF